MEIIEIEKCGPIGGTVKIQGSKNSSLGLLATACMADSPVTLEGIPKIEDVYTICHIGKEMGIDFEFKNNHININPCHIHSTNINPMLSSKFRSSYYFIGALINKYKYLSLGYPGGDDFGDRPIDQHLKALKAMGCKFSFHKNHYTVEANNLKGADIHFDMITSGATINGMMAASTATGETTLRNCAIDPEVIDIANFLNLMGANIRGAGTSTITIDGVESLKGNVTYQVIPDRLIAGTLLMAAGITRGTITLENVIPEHLNSCIAKLKEIGMEFDIRDNQITAYGNRKLQSASITAGMYPNFATDLQQPITALLLSIDGNSTIKDSVYPDRTSHIKQLNKMGAKISYTGREIAMAGNHQLRGSNVTATDVRAGLCLILAGLIAEGKTKILDVYHINRGFEDPVKIFTDLGASIKLSTAKAPVLSINTDFFREANQ